MRIVWVVMNDAYKPIATFEYTQKEAADTKAAELTAKGRGTHFVQRTKEPMPEDAPGLGAIIPRAETAVAESGRSGSSGPPSRTMEELDEEEDADIEMDEEPDDDEE